MAEEREVRALREAHAVVEDSQFSELDEVVAAAARAELSPGAIFHPRRHVRDAPVAIHHVVVARLSERGAHSKPGLPLEDPGQTGLVVRQRGHGEVEHRHLHPARNVDADGVWDDRFVGGQDAADRKAVSDVRVRHERARHGDRQPARVLHLPHGVRFDIAAPNPIRSITCLHFTSVPGSNVNGSHRIAILNMA